MQVTLQDVARLAKVSAKTVSRVVNNQGEISSATRLRVQGAIEELGYRPNMLARGLVSQRSHTLAVVASGLEYYGPSRTLTGIEQHSTELGYSLLFSLLTHSNETDVLPILDSITARRADGIIWAVPEIGDNRAWIQPEILKRLPPVVFLTMQPVDGVSVVSVNNQSGAYLATQHLIDLGFTRIGLITGPMTWWEGRERLVGFESAMKNAGLDFQDSQVMEGDWTAVSGKRAMEALLNQRPDLDAIFAGNDQMALGAQGAVHQSGRKIPHDMALVGFDNMAESACFWPPLTTVEQHLFDAGCTAVKVLQRMIESRQNGQDNLMAEVVVLEPQLIIRESSTGVPSEACV